MNGSITDLGEWLAGAYRNKWIQWSAMESIFPADELSASSGLADDVLRLENEWQAFAGLGQTLQMDFLPQDLLVFFPSNLPPEPQPLQGVKKAGDHSFTRPAGSGFTSVSAQVSTASLPPEQQPRPSFVRGEYYPFILPAGNSVTHTPAGAGQPPAENDAAANTALPAPDSGYDFPATQPMPLPRPENRDLLSGDPENSTQVLRNDVSAVSSTNLFQAPPEDAPDPVQRQGLISPENPDFSQPGLFSDSIWLQPLQNMGDFAMQVVQPVTEKSGKGMPAPSQVTVPGTAPRSPELDSQAGDGSVQLPQGPHWPGIPKPFETVPLPGTPESILPGAQMGDSIYPYAPETNRNIPDTDDLLEALTDRIIRDFHRYYP